MYPWYADAPVPRQRGSRPPNSVEQVLHPETDAAGAHHRAAHCARLPVQVVAMMSGLVDVKEEIRVTSVEGRSDTSQVARAWQRREDDLGRSPENMLPGGWGVL